MSSEVHQCRLQSEVDADNEAAWRADRHNGLVPREIEIVRTNGSIRIEIGGEYFCVVKFCPFCGTDLNVSSAFTLLDDAAEVEALRTELATRARLIKGG